MTTLHLKKSIDRSPLRLGVPVVLLALACFAVSPKALAVDPAPDGGYPNGNTAEGDGALFSLTSGSNNTANGFQALFSNTTGDWNTANGAYALQSNTEGGQNTAIGAQALFSNTTGGSNTATGFNTLVRNTTGNANTATGENALVSNTTGSYNTATGVGALQNNTTGYFNTANGVVALSNNTTGTNNTANGYFALVNNTTGNNNTATGYSALVTNTTGSFNTADGLNALFDNTAGPNNTACGYAALASNTTGSGNIAIGKQAGVNLTTGNNNIDIGSVGAVGEANKIRIGKIGTQIATFIAGIYNVNEGGTIKPLYINSNGQLGTQAPASARRFKKQIKPMDQTSEAILGLKPVTFQYKSDSAATPQFGLIAEEVAKVNPDLVVRDENGEIYTVRYEAVNAMLLNEFLKAHQKLEEQQATIERQQKQIDALTVGLQKVSARRESSNPAPRVVSNR